MLRKFFLLYRKLFFHLIFIWLILIIAFSSFYGIVSLETYFTNVLQEQLSECEVVLYLDSNANPQKLENELTRYGFIENIQIDYNSQTLQKLEHDFELYQLHKWLQAETLPHVLVFNLSPTNFTLPKFQQLIKNFSTNIEIRKIDFDTHSIVQINNRMRKLFKYKNYPLYIIGFLAIVLIFLIQRLMRVKRKKLWRQWRALEGIRTYKISHSILEFIFSAIFTLGTFIFINYKWGSQFLSNFHIDLIHFHPLWYWTGGLFAAYMLLTLLNFIEIKKR